MRKFLIAFSVLSLGMSIGCGGGSGSSATKTTIAAPSQNSQPIVVDGGPPAFVTNPNGGIYADAAFVTVTVCVPGSTTCNTIDHVLVDTGSVGLRLLHSASQGELTVNLPTTSVGGTPVGECTQFADNSFLWGPVATADVKIAGEVASSIPVNIVGDTTNANFTTVPASCNTGGVDDDTLVNLGAYGILGVGIVPYDCGTACASGTPPAGAYYSCPSAASCAPSLLPVAQQVQNPISRFASDNNGVILELPVPTGVEPSLTGSMVFGIGTQSDNALGSATVFTLDQNGNFTTKFNGNTMSNSFIDSGSNGFFFDDSSIPNCSNAGGFYCPATPLNNLSAVNSGNNGTPSAVTFNVINADNAFTTNDAVIPGLAGPMNDSTSFDWGLPFFYGRNVYTSIASPSAAPFWAY